MPKSFKVLSINQKHAIINLVRKGVSGSEVAELFSDSRCTLSYRSLIWDNRILVWRKVSEEWSS